MTITTTAPAPQARLVSLVVEVDPDFIDETAPTGLTTAGHIELRDAIGQVGTVAHISRTARPVPAPPALPVKSERTRALARRREALERSVALHCARGTHAITVIEDAKRFEEYLNGENAEEKG